MITRLIIENLALVERAEIDFESGMSVLTGETGEGKSIVVTAINLAIGGRAEREFVRTGEETATVEAWFDVSAMPAAYKRAFSDHLSDNRFAVRREIAVNGSSRVKINSELSTLSKLRELTGPLAEILSQHSNQILLDEVNHLLFLDHFAGVDDLREEVAALFANWERLTAKIRQLRNRREQLQNERELMLFQRNELESANVRVGEEKELVNEKRILDSSRTLIQSATLIQDLLDHDDGSALTYVKQARKELERMVRIDATLESHANDLIDIDYRLEELRRLIEQYGNTVPDNPARLDDINERLAELFELKRKYGDGEEEMLKTLQSIKRKLEDRPDVETELADLEREQVRTKTAYAGKALSLTAVRTKAARYLEKLTVNELADLAIDKAQFRFDFEYTDDPDGVQLSDDRTVAAQAHGLETGRIMFSANPGEPLKSLVKTASGGEISRLLLALKAAEKKNAKVSQSLLVFDEVDAGIGGTTANEVARKLQGLSDSCQLIVVTHLHQIARLAAHHYVARKGPRRDARTIINILRLEDSAVAKELDRMVALPD